MSAIPVDTLPGERERLPGQEHRADAAECVERAVEDSVEADERAAGRWMTHMLAGNFDAAWRESDAIRGRGNADPHRFWQGESLAGRHVMLRCLHGFGDATQFLRYVPRLRAMTASLTVEVPPRFERLARCFDGVEDVITWGVSAPAKPPAWEVQIEVMELPYLFRTRLSDLPLTAKYLRLPASPGLNKVPDRRLRVGLAWNAGAWNPARSIGPEVLLPILAIRGCEFWSLDGGPGQVPGREPDAFRVKGRAPCRETIEGLAATIAQLDLVITVDTLAAHLAGALGVSAWVLLQHAADWRWMRERTDSPWYPSLSLFRQAVAGDWESAIAEVCDRLKDAALLHEADAAREGTKTR